MHSIRPVHPAIPPQVDPQPSTAPFQVGNGAVPRVHIHHRRRLPGSPPQLAMPAKRPAMGPADHAPTSQGPSATLAGTPPQPNVGTWRASLAVARHTSPKRAITLDTIRNASQLLAYDKCPDIRTCARKYDVSERELRSFVKPDGNFTAVGHRVNMRTLQAPGDRIQSKLPPMERKTALTAQDFTLADQLLGRSVGKMSRTLFCDLFGYDYATVFRTYAKNGSITPWGRANRDAAFATASSQADAASVPDGAATASATTQEAAKQAAAERRLAELANREGIAIGYWDDVGFRKLGMPGSDFAGDVDRTRGQWRIRPARGGQYQLAPDAREMDHIVNILRLHGQGGRQAVADSYDISTPDDGHPILLAPKPGALPAEPPADAAGES